MGTQKPFSLIVEDDVDLSDIFSEALNAAGFATEIVRNGRLALNRLADLTPDIIILDLHLPEVSGADILKYVRSEARLEDVNVVLTTADAIMAEQLRDQADFVMVKPISFSQLRDLTTRLKPTVH